MCMSSTAAQGPFVTKHSTTYCVMSQGTENASIPCDIVWHVASHRITGSSNVDIVWTRFKGCGSLECDHSVCMFIRQFANRGQSLPLVHTSPVLLGLIWRPLLWAYCVWTWLGSGQRRGTKKERKEGQTRVMLPLLPLPLLTSPTLHNRKHPAPILRLASPGW